MARTYEPKYLADGRTPNPMYRPDVRKRPGDRHKNRGRGTKWAMGSFVGWDSEGADIAGSHELIIAANSAGWTLTDANGLDPVTVLRAMAEELARDPLAIHVSYAFGYDACMLLRGLPATTLQRLWRGGRVVWGDLMILYRPRKTFGVYRIAPDGTKRGGMIWDVFGFCQSTFVAALEKYRVEADGEYIRAMKAKRPQFKPEMLPEILAYCQTECRLLADLAGKIRDGFREAGLTLTRFDGAGAAGAALLAKHGVKQYIGKVPARVEREARKAYFGGRIECLVYGHRPKDRIYEYDINSAYPSAAQHLPCLKHARWRRARRDEIETAAHGIARIEWRFKRQRRFYPFPFRSGRTERIYFPPEGAGWYHLCEIQAALHAGEIVRDCSKCTVGEGWICESDCDCEPFGFIAEAYLQRQQWKREGRGAEKAIKLALNSVYGKLAQQVGGGLHGPPPYHQLFWAGEITAATRAKLYRAAMQQPDAILMFATDAIYSRRPLDLPISDRLGEWDCEIHQGATIVQSGVYWMGGEARTPSASRGFDAASLDREAVLAAWRAGKKSLDAYHTRFVGLGEAAGLGRMSIFGTWQTAPRKLSLTPEGTKRDPVGPRRPWNAFCSTRASMPDAFVRAISEGEIIPQIESAPIMRPWDRDPCAEIYSSSAFVPRKYRDVTERLERDAMNESTEWAI